MQYTITFDRLVNSQVAQVGGKNASLGEMYQRLRPKGIKVPDGFATTAEAFWDFIESNELKSPISEALKRLDREKFSNLGEVGKEIRDLIMNAVLPENFIGAIKKSYAEFKSREKDLESVAVRSSATPEDLPEAC